jgi:hypothetical protein
MNINTSAQMTTASLFVGQEHRESAIAAHFGSGGERYPCLGYGGMIAVIDSSRPTYPVSHIQAGVSHLPRTRSFVGIWADSVCQTKLGERDGAYSSGRSTTSAAV